jgi:hypothetical protein
MYDTKIDIENENRKKIAESLLEKLPHGSGINGDWNIFQKANPNVYYASNYYDSMTEYGMYDRVYPFTARYIYHGKNASEPCQYCNGKGVRSVMELQKNHYPNKTLEETIEFLESRFIMVNKETNEFECLSCAGTGVNEHNEFSLQGINFHGQSIKANQAGLRDYLFDTLYLD